MLDATRLYLRYAGISIRSQMQHRASFLMLALGNFLLTAIDFGAIWILFDRFGQLRDWSLAQVGLIYGIVHVAFALAEGMARGFDTFDRLIKSGNFDRVLLRPRSAAFQVGASELQLMRIGRFAQGTIVLIWAMISLNVGWDVPRLALLLAAIVSGAMIFAGLFIIQATIAFWTTESLELVNTLTYGGVETAQFPISIYRPGFRRFFTFVVPLACANYLPALAILDKPDPLGIAPAFQWLAPVAGGAFLNVALQFWKVGVRRYTSTGS